MGGSKLIIMTRAIEHDVCSMLAVANAQFNDSSQSGVLVVMIERNRLVLLIMSGSLRLAILRLQPPCPAQSKLFPRPCD